jgi:hypothetical protein
MGTSLAQIQPARGAGPGRRGGGLVDDTYTRTHVLRHDARGSIIERNEPVIRHARELGFELTSVRALLALQKQPDLSCATACELAGAQLTIVENRLRRLTALRTELRRMVRCGNGRVADCRVIDALAKVN